MAVTLDMATETIVTVAMDTTTEPTRATEVVTTMDMAMVRATAVTAMAMGQVTMAVTTRIIINTATMIKFIPTMHVGKLTTKGTIAAAITQLTSNTTVIAGIECQKHAR